MVVHLLWESDVQHAGQEDETTMKRHRHTPEQIVRKLCEGDRLLNGGKDLAEVLRDLEVSESSWNRWRNQYGGMKANEAKRLRELESGGCQAEEAPRRGRAGQGDAQGAGGGKFLTPERRRRAVGVLVDRFGVSERRACRVIGQHRSTQRLAPRPRPAEEEKVRRRLREIARRHPWWGWKTAHTILRREGHIINRKRTRRLWRDEGLRRAPPPKRKRTRPAGGGPLLRAERPNHVWAIDFQFDETADRRRLKLCNIVDEHTREALAMDVGR